METSLISFPCLYSNSVNPRHLPTVERGPSTSFQGTKCLTDVGIEGSKYPRRSPILCEFCASLEPKPHNESGMSHNLVVLTY